MQVSRVFLFFFFANALMSVIVGHPLQSLGTSLQCLVIELLLGWTWPRDQSRGLACQKS
jgi:hypothetical protein